MTREGGRASLQRANLVLLLLTGLGLRLAVRVHVLLRCV